jgi:hypothetical protein
MDKVNRSDLHTGAIIISNPQNVTGDGDCISLL